MGNNMRLLINGSLVRAQQAEPINQLLSEKILADSCCNLERVLNPAVKSPWIAGSAHNFLSSKARSPRRRIEPFCHAPNFSNLLSSAQQHTITNRGIEHV